MNEIKNNDKNLAPYQKLTVINKSADFYSEIGESVLCCKTVIAH